MTFFNHNSFAILSGFALAGVAAFLLIARAPRSGWLVWLGLALALVAINLALRTGTSTLDTPDKVEAALRNDRPTLLEFYSDL